MFIKIHLPNTIRVIKSKMMIWTGHITQKGEMINTHKILVRKPERKRHGWILTL
jgi:hypothetical protein